MLFTKNLIGFFVLRSLNVFGYFFAYLCTHIRSLWYWFRHWYGFKFRKFGA